MQADMFAPLPNFRRFSLAYKELSGATGSGRLLRISPFGAFATKPTYVK
jgi:hypothetical protein